MSAPERPQHRPDWPSVTVIVLNFNGYEHLPPCFDSLGRTDYPGELELMLADNGSTDASLEHMRRHHAQVTLVENGANIGFAAGNNRGVERARGEYVVFLNNDMRVEPDWLRHLLAPMNPAEGLICTAGKILRWDGRAVDYVGGKINFSGHGFQKDFGSPYTPLSYAEPAPVLFACGGAMCIQRQTFQEVGGFDEDFFAYFEDVDLGYRLWALGYRIEFAPGAVIYHRHHGTSDRVPYHQLRVLFERNALAMIVKNYEQATLDRVLPIALMLTVKRGLINARLERSHYDLHNRSPQALSEVESVQRLSFSFFLGIEAFGEQLPQLQRKRAVIQARRKRSDQEIFHLFHDRLLDPVFPGMEYGQTQQRLIDVLGLPDFFLAPEPVHLLFITPQPLSETSGWLARYRAWAAALASDLRVTLAGHGQAESSPAEYAERGYDPAVPESIIHILNRADVLIAPAVVAAEMEYLWHLGVLKPLVVDLSGERPEGLGGAERLKRVLAYADFFVCEDEAARAAWLAALDAHGRVAGSNAAADPSLRRLIDVGLEPLRRYSLAPTIAPDKRDDLKERSVLPRPSQHRPLHPLLALPLEAWNAVREGGLKWFGFLVKEALVAVREGGLRQLIYKAQKYLEWRRQTGRTR